MYVYIYIYINNNNNSNIHVYVYIYIHTLNKKWEKIQTKENSRMKAHIFCIIIFRTRKVSISPMESPLRSRVLSPTGTY